MDEMAWLNGLGLLNAVICAIAICVVSLIKIFHNREELTAGFLSYKIFDWRGSLIAYNIYVFSMGSLMVPAVFCEMKEKSRFKELS